MYGSVDGVASLVVARPARQNERRAAKESRGYVLEGELAAFQVVFTQQATAEGAWVQPRAQAGQVHWAPVNEKMLSNPLPGGHPGFEVSMSQVRRSHRHQRRNLVIAVVNPTRCAGSMIQVRVHGWQL